MLFLVVAAETVTRYYPCYYPVTLYLDLSDSVNVWFNKQLGMVLRYSWNDLLLNNIFER